MVGNIILSFSTLASAFRLKAPLPPYLPPAEASRQRLVSLQRNRFEQKLMFLRSRLFGSWTLCETVMSRGPASYSSSRMRSR
jgi:hypothetical protein